MDVLNETRVACTTGAFQLCPRSEHTAVRAGPHNGDTGPVAGSPHSSEVGKKHAKIYTISMAQTLPGHNSWGDSFVEFNAKASRRRYGAEQADPPKPVVCFKRGGGACHGEETARSGVIEIRRQQKIRSACEI